MSSQTVNTIAEMIYYHHNNIRTLFDLSEDALNWQPAENKHSIALLLDHYIGAEMFWIQDVIADVDTKRIRDNEFEHKKRSKNDLIIKFELVDKNTKEILSEKISDNNLYEKRTARGRNRNFTVLWCLLHVLEHGNYHIGQMNLIKGLLPKELLNNKII